MSEFQVVRIDTLTHAHRRNYLSLDERHIWGKLAAIVTDSEAHLSRL